MINAVTGITSCSPFFQRAAGWCEAAESIGLLAPEQPAEMVSPRVGMDGFLPLQGKAFAELLMPKSGRFFKRQQEWYRGKADSFRFLYRAAGQEMGAFFIVPIAF